MDTIKTNQIEIGGKLLDIEPKKLNGNVQINLTGDVSGSIDTPIEAGHTINITTKLEKEIPGGGDEPEIFKIIPGIEDLGIDPTPFTDILEASRAGKYLVVECGIEGTYILNGTVTNFNYDEDDQTGGLQCVVSMEVPEYYMTPIKYICDLAYDASAATTDTWTVSEPVNIMAPDDISEDGMVPTLQTLYGDRKVISWKFPAVVEVEHLSTTPYTDVASIMARGSSPVYWELGTLYLYLGIGTVDSATGYVFGSIRQEDDGTLYMQKRVAKSDETWYAPSTHFPIGGGGADNTFVVTPGAIAAVTDTPTPFTDIKTAFQASKVIQAHAIVNGEGVYGYLQAFQFNTTTNKGTAVFAFYNSNPNYLNGTDFIITCSYDASASPTDTWEQSVQMPIPAPAASDANKVLKANSSGRAVGWDKVKSSELTNDAGFSKVVVGNAPPAAGTPDDTITLILGGAGGAGEYGAWEEICSCDTATHSGATFQLSKPISQFDFILLYTYGIYGSKIYSGSGVYAVSNISFGTNYIYTGNDYSNGIRFNFIDVNTVKVAELFAAFNCFKVYGINLRGRKDEYALRKVDGQIWNRGTNSLDTNLAISANHKIIIKAYAHFLSGTACALLASTSTSWQSSSTHYLSLCTWNGNFCFCGNNSDGELVFGGVSEGDFVTIILNDDNGHVTMNGTDVGVSKRLQEIGNYRINRRNDSPYNGNFVSIQVIDKTTNEEVMFVHSYEIQGPDGVTFKKVILDDHNHFTPIIV